MLRKREREGARARDRERERERERDGEGRGRGGTCPRMLWASFRSLLIEGCDASICAGTLDSRVSRVEGKRGQLSRGAREQGSRARPCMRSRCAHGTSIPPSDGPHARAYPDRVMCMKLTLGQSRRGRGKDTTRSLCVQRASIEVTFQQSSRRDTENPRGARERRGKAQHLRELHKSPLLRLGPAGRLGCRFRVWSLGIDHGSGSDVI